MAELVLGIGTSHGSMLSTPPQEWDGRAAADRRNKSLAFRGNAYSFDQLYALRQAEDFAARNTAPARQAHYDRCQKQLDALGDILTATKPDIMVVIGDDQHEWFTEELQPTFGIFCGEQVINFAPTAEEMEQHTREGRGAVNQRQSPAGGSALSSRARPRRAYDRPGDAGWFRCRGDHGAAQKRV